MQRFIPTVLLLLVAARVHADPMADSLFMRANQLLEEGRPADAADAYLAIEHSGFEAAALDLNLGLALQEIGHSGEALFRFARAERRGEPRAAAQAQRLREQLGLPTSTSGGGTAGPLTWIWIGGAVLIATGILLVIQRTRRRVGAALLLGGGVVALVAAGWSAVGASRSEGMIVRGPAIVYDAHDGLTPGRTTLAEGQQVTILDEDGARVRIRMGNAAEGWVDRHRVREF